MKNAVLKRAARNKAGNLGKNKLGFLNKEAIVAEKEREEGKQVPIPGRHKKKKSGFDFGDRPTKA